MSLEQEIKDFLNAQYNTKNIRPDYTTNSKSYYDYLEKVTAILFFMSKKIDEYDGILTSELQKLKNTLDDYLEKWDENLESFDESVLILLQEWMDDGTFEHIINHEIFKNKLDTSIFEQFELSVNQQLQHNVSHIVDIKEVYGATGNGVDSDVEPLLEGIQDNVTLGFPDGVYVIDEPILIENKNVKWVALGDNVVILDKGKDVSLEDNSIVNTPVGVRFENSQVQLTNFIFDNNVIKGGLVHTLEKNNIVPQFDFYNCDVILDNISVKGRIQPHIGSLEENTALSVMRSSFMRFYQCNSVTIKNPQLLDGSGSGEVFVFLESKNIKFLDSKHSTHTSETTFWSLAKMIKCENVQINGSDIRSWSSGSFIDVTGDNILFENIHIDYENGKLLDVSSEWGEEGGNIGTVVIKNSSTNGFGIFNSNSDLNYTTEIEKIIIENLAINVSLAKAQNQNYWGIYPNYTNNVYARDISMHNVRNILYYYSDDVNTHKKMNAVIENITISKDDTLSTIHQIEGHGYLRINNIDYKSKGSLSFIDRYLLKTGLKANEVQSEIIVENSNFENIVIYLSGNIKFVNCHFKNVRFVNTTPIEHSTIEFKDCRLNFISSNDSITATGNIFEFDSALNYHVVLDNTRITGETFNNSAYPLFYRVDADLKNSTIELIRIKTGQVKDEYALYSPHSNKVIEINNTLLGEYVKVIPSTPLEYNDTFVTIKNSVIKNNKGIDFENVDNMNLIVMNNQVKKDVLYNLGSRFESRKTQFKSLVEGNNIEY